MTGKTFKHCMFELKLQIGSYDQNLMRKKEDFEIKSDLFWQNTFLELWKLKFIIIQLGSIRFWNISLCFCVRYKVFSVYCTLSQTEKSSVNKEDFETKFDLIWQKPFLNSLKLMFISIQFGSIRFQTYFLLFLSCFY